MPAKLPDSERERRKRMRRQVKEIIREAELLAFVVNDIKKHYGRDQFPMIIAQIEPCQSPAHIAALWRALYE